MKSLLLSCGILISLSLFAQKTKGDRTLAWQIDMAENGNYDSAFLYGYQGCMESLHLAVNWNSIEPDKDNFDQSFMQGILDIANVYYPAYGIPVELQLATINTVSKEVPDDLKTIDFDNSAMINRFKVMLDTLFVHIPDLKLSALNIGNECESFLGVNASNYTKYKTFLDSVIPYAKQKYMDIHGDELLIGATFTLHGLLDDNTKAMCKSVNTGLDIISTTFYPLKSDYTMEDPSTVSGTFADLVAEYPDSTQPIYFVECGYSSSTLCNSSEQKQATFYEKVFDAWDTHSANIKYLTIFKSTDWAASEIQQFKDFYGVADTVFGEYLRTLGVRTYPGNGESKLAYGTILCELANRNWCNVQCTAGVNELDAVALSIYPNPAHNVINVDAIKPVESIILLDITGKELLTTQSQSLDISSYPAGIYFLKMKFGSQMVSSKIVITR